MYAVVWLDAVSGVRASNPIGQIWRRLGFVLVVLVLTRSGLEAMGRTTISFIKAVCGGDPGMFGGASHHLLLRWHGAIDEKGADAVVDGFRWPQGILEILTWRTSLPS